MRVELFSRWCRSRRLLAVLCVVAVAGGTLAATAAGSGAGGAALGTVVVKMQGDWPTFDPYVDAGFATGWYAVAPGYDRLLSWGPDGAKSVLPYLATGYKQT